jgi:hypothetical protein
MESICKVVHLDNDERVEFPRLSLEELFSIGEDISSQREREVEQLGRQDKLDKLDISNLKLEMRLKKPSIQEILALCHTPQIASKVLRTSLNKAKVDPKQHAEIISQLAIPDALVLAKNLVLDVQDEPEVKAEVKTESPLDAAVSLALADDPKLAGYGSGK